MIVNQFLSAASIRPTVFSSLFSGEIGVAPLRGKLIRQSHRRCFDWNYFLYEIIPSSFIVSFVSSCLLHSFMCSNMLQCGTEGRNPLIPARNLLLYGTEVRNSSIPAGNQLRYGCKCLLRTQCIKPNLISYENIF